MFGKRYEDRLLYWHEFRKKLETSDDPLQDVIDAYNQIPLVSIQTDPWDQATWPTPWELLLENEYCEYCKLLGMCYTLQLTDSFSGSNFEIHIGIDEENKSYFYLLIIDDRVLNYEADRHVHRSEIPKSFKPQTKYQLPPIQ